MNIALEIIFWTSLTVYILAKIRSIQKMKIEHKFEYTWGGEDNWYTKSKRWANKQNPVVRHLALGFIEWLWVKWIWRKSTDGNGIR